MECDRSIGDWPRLLRQNVVCAENGPPTDETNTVRSMSASGDLTIPQFVTGRLRTVPLPIHANHHQQLLTAAACRHVSQSCVSNTR